MPQAIKGIRDKVQLATKFGNVIENNQYSIRGDPAWVRVACEASLKRLDVDHIDLYYQHRVDSKVPIEITVSTRSRCMCYKLEMIICELDFWLRILITVNAM